MTNEKTTDSAASALSAGFGAHLPEYFHELNDEQWETLKASGMTWEEAAKRFKPPAWCTYQDAVDPLGCWSLVGRMVKGEDYCKDCDLHKTPNVELSGPQAGLSPEGRARTQGYASAVITEEGK